jgi:hypothetical protein
VWLRFKRDQHDAQWSIECEEIAGEDWLADAREILW